jgi:hypothetical protein
MQIIGISGKIGVGKTTIAQNIALSREGWQISAFADLLKEEVARQYHFDLRLAYSDKGKETLIKLPDGPSKTVRELLQYYGTEVVRAKDQNYWVRGMEQHLAIARHKIDGLVIDDVRFPNEAGLIRRWRGLLVRIEPYPGYQTVSDHASETALDDYKGFALTLRPEYGGSHLQRAAEEIVEACRG